MVDKQEELCGGAGAAGVGVGVGAGAGVGVGAGAADNTDAASSVSQHYAEVAQSVAATFGASTPLGAASCCEPAMSAGEAAFLYARDALADLPECAVAASRGCGDPVAKALLQPGERVLDLGSGGGIDAIIASRLVGETGHVYGVDMTPAMIELARANAAAVGAQNIEFLQGNIEELPLEDACVNVVLSNCVINFAQKKQQVMSEAHRVLVPGGRFVVSDIVRYGPLPHEKYAEPLGRITGCTNGIELAETYKQHLLDAGFTQVELEPKTTYTLEVLREKAQRKDRMEFFEALENNPALDSLCGSVIITAR
jgi:arsenite methyltransferase